MTSITSFTHYVPLALATAKPTAFDPDYIMLGLQSEIGEVAGKLAKYVLSGRTEEAFRKMRDGMILELGDVRWYLALAHHVKAMPELGETSCYLPVLDSEEERYQWILHDIKNMRRHVGILEWQTFTFSDVKHLLFTIDHLARLIDSDPAEVAGLNIAKLNGRWEADTIIGNGDGVIR